MNSDVAPERLPIFVAERTDKLVDVFRGMWQKGITAVPVVLKGHRTLYGYLELMDVVMIANHCIICNTHVT
jgi:hypothetical protein